jgi:hypothetical protein
VWCWISCVRKLFELAVYEETVHVLYQSSPAHGMQRSSFRTQQLLGAVHRCQAPTSGRHQPRPSPAVSRPSHEIWPSGPLHCPLINISTHSAYSAVRTVAEGVLVIRSEKEVVTLSYAPR